MGMFLSLGKSSVPSSRELAGLGLRLPPQPSHPHRGHLEEGVSPSAPGRGPISASAHACRHMACTRTGLPLAHRADISASQQAPWLPSFDALQGVQLESNEWQNSCQRFLTCLERAVFSSGLEIMLNQTILHEAHTCAKTVYLHMLFGASRSTVRC